MPIIIMKNLNLILIVCVLTPFLVYDQVSAIAVDKNPHQVGERMRITTFPEGLDEGAIMPEPKGKGEVFLRNTVVSVITCQTLLCILH